MAGFLRRLVLLVVGLGVATVLLVGAMSALTATTKAGPVLQRDHVGAVERGVARQADEPASEGSSSPSVPAVALVLGGLVLLAALPSAQRVHVHHHRLPWSD
jgi:hypothetical protein